MKNDLARVGVLVGLTTCVGCVAATEDDVAGREEAFEIVSCTIETCLPPYYCSGGDCVRGWQTGCEPNEGGADENGLCPTYSRCEDGLCVPYRCVSSDQCGRLESEHGICCYRAGVCGPADPRLCADGEGDGLRWPRAPVVY